MPRKSNSSKTVNQFRETIYNLKQETQDIQERISKGRFSESVFGEPTHVSELQNQKDLYCKKIEDMSSYIQELDSQITEAEAKLKQKRELISEQYKFNETDEKIKAELKKADFSLEKTKQHLNEAVSNNKDLKEKVDSLRRERHVRENIKQSLQEEVELKNNKLFSVSRKSQKALKKNQESKTKLAKLKEELQTQRKEFSKLEHEINQMLSDDNGLKDYIYAEPERIDFSEDIEDKMIKNIQQRTKILHEDKNNIKNSIKEIEDYKKALEELKQATGQTEIKDLIRIFAEAEKRNHSYYNYFSELNQQNDNLEIEISRIRSLVHKYKKINQSAQEERQQKMNHLERKKNLIEARNEEYQKKYEKSFETLESIKSNLADILPRMGHGLKVSQEGDEKYSNIIHNLSLMETIASSFESHTCPNPLFQAKKKLHIEAPLCTEKETTNEDDESYLPLSRDQMRDRAIFKSAAFRNS